MNYTNTLNWMFSQLPMYQRQGNTAFKKDLTNSLALSKYLNYPEQNLSSFCSCNIGSMLLSAPSPLIAYAIFIYHVGTVISFSG